ncbi:MAG: ribosome-associated translation inhibitor RaiA [Actinomycetia bacterium]|nr:ribosome-associated translation inhibitor RaiA [Actinomycetes bacterium]
MNITITGRKMSVGEELRDFVETRIDSATKVFKIDPMTVEVVLRSEKNPAHPRPTSAEITLRTKGHVIRTEGSSTDIHAALEGAASKLERQLRKFKTRVIDKRQTGPKLTEVLESVSAMPGTHSFDDDESDQLVRIKEIDLDVLDTDAAMLQMDLLGHDFFVFDSAETGATNVLYRRRDGGYGLIRPRLESNDD